MTAERAAKGPAARKPRRRAAARVPREDAAPKGVLFRVAGAGGKGGGGGRAPFETENNLRSKASGQFMDVLSEGPIRGFANGLRSVFFNDTPLMNADGTLNFKGALVTLMAGLPDQAVLSGFEDLSATPNTTNVGVQVKKALGPVTRTIPKSAARSARVTIQIPALYRADTKTGDVLNNKVAFRIDLQVDGGPFNTVQTITETGKTNSGVTRDYKVPLPPCQNAWALRVERLSDDTDESSTEATGIFWESFTTFVEWPLVYPDTSYAAIALDAETFGNQIPARTYDLMGLQVKVPSNYDPDARVYTGVWDGTFKVAWTQNPAWVFYDLLTNKRYGLGTAIDEGAVDKWSLYTIGQYCDGGVPDGNGGLEPRFTFNGVLNTLEDAYTVLQTVASCFRGMAYYGAGVITATQDSPAGTPAKLVTNASVLDGVFVYEGTSLKSRHTVAHVVFNDAGNDYRPTVEVVQAEDGSIQRSGHRPVDVQAVGCTSRSQARRIGKWMLDSERTATETVTYRAGLDHADLRPGDVIAVADRWYTGLRMGGRVARADEGRVVVDAPVAVVAGHAHKLRLTLPDGTVAERTLTNGPGSHTELFFSPPLSLSALPQPESVWTIDVPTADAASGTVAQRPFRVIQVAETEPGVFAVTALLHEEAKYDRIEFGINRAPPVYSTALKGPLGAPSNLAVAEELVGVGVTSMVRATLSFRPTTDRRARAYQVQAISAGVVIRNEVTEVPTFAFENLNPGVYTFQARTLGDDALQLVSAWATTGAVNVDGVADPPGPATTLSAVGAVRSVVLRWTNPQAKYLRAVEVWAGSTNAFSAASKVGESKDGTFIHGPLPPDTTWWYWIRSSDIFGQPATVQPSQFLGPVSATTSYLVAADIQDGIINTAKFAQGIQPVSIIADLTVTAPDQTVAVNQQDGKLYVRQNGEWRPMVEALGPGGTLTSEQIESLDAAKLGGSLQAAVFPPGLRPVERVDALPATGNFEGRQVYLTAAAGAAGGKLYRWTHPTETTGTARWSAQVAAADVNGALAAANFPQNLRPVERVAALPSSGNFKGRVVLLEADDKIYRWTHATATTGTASWSKAVDGADLLADSVTANQIAAGAVTAAEIAAGTITADKLVIADMTNRVENPNFAAGAAGWVFTGSGVSVVQNDAANAFVGHSYLRLAAGANGICARTVNVFPVLPGEKYLVRATCRALNAPANALQVRVRFMGADKSTVVTALGPSFPVTDTAYTTRQAVATAPAGAVWAWVDFLANTVAGASEWRCGEVFCTRQAGGELIVDGAVTADKIGALAVTAGKIDANAVTAGTIAAGTVTAAEIGAGAVTASKIKVAPASLNFDPYFQDAAGWIYAAAPAQGWYLEAFPGSALAVPSHAALWSQHYTGTGAPAVTGKARAPVTPGERIAFRAKGHNAGNRNVVAQLNFVGADDAFLSAIVLAWAPGTTSSHKEAQGTVPANAVACYFQVYVSSGASAWNGVAYLSELNAWRPASASMIVDGAITADKLAANAVTAQKIAAGAITTEKLAVGPGSGNRVSNSCMAHSSYGWLPGGSVPPSHHGRVGHGDAGDPGAGWRLAGVGTGFAARLAAGANTIPAGQWMDYWWQPDGHYVPIAPSTWWEFSARLQLHRCALRMIIQFFDNAGNQVGESIVATSEAHASAGGTQLDEYKFLWGKAQAPANAHRARPLFRVLGLNAGVSASGASPYLFFTQAQFCPATANQTEAAPFAPGGVTEIAGGMIRANEINANHLTANSVTAGKIAADAITAGTIAAGAVRADQIAAGQLKAIHMASDVIITGTLQVADLIIGTGKITGGAASGINFSDQHRSFNVACTPDARGPIYAVLTTCTISIDPASDGRVMVTWYNPHAYQSEPAYMDYGSGGAGGPGGGE